MRKLVLSTLLGLTLVSCGKVETPEEFFDLTGKQGNDGSNGQNGVNGSNGLNGQDGSFEGEIEYVEVCNDTNMQYVETLVLINGKYMAFMSDKNYMKQRLVLLEEYTDYRTTDSRLIIFRIENGEIICN